MSSHQASSKPRSSKCRHFCFPFDLHNYWPTCRESGKGDDPCVTNLSTCDICTNFTEEQTSKIKNRHLYTRKQKSDIITSKDDLDLLGDDEESFTGTQADLEGAAENLFSTPPRPQPLRFESLSLKTPHNVPPTPGTALLNKIESRLEKSLDSSLNIQLKQDMGVFQASMLEAMKNLRDEMLSFHKASESGVDKTSDSAQAKPMPGTSAQSDPLTRTSNPTPSEHLDVQPMDREPYGSPLPPKSSQPQSEHASKHSDVESNHSECCSDSEYYQVSPKHKHSDKRKHKSKPSHISQSLAEEDESSTHVKTLTQPQHKVPPEPQPQDNTDPVFYREMNMSDLPSQYTEEVETFRQILDLPDPRETLPRSSTTVLGLDDEKGQQELRPKGPSAMLPMNPILKDTFEKFEL